MLTVKIQSGKDMTDSIRNILCSARRKMGSNYNSLSRVQYHQREGKSEAELQGFPRTIRRLGQGWLGRSRLGLAHQRKLWGRVQRTHAS